MSIIETLVVFGGIPLAVVAVITGLIFAGSARSNDRRYRPGRRFEFAPVWFLSAPEQQHSTAAANGHTPAVTGANRLALEKAEAEPAAPIGDTTGGASDRW